MDSVAAKDQMQTACRVMAETAATFRTELVKAGFTIETAENMVVLWMDHVLEGWCHDPRNV